MQERSSSRRFGYFSEPDAIAGKSTLIQLVLTFMQQDKSKDTRDLVMPVVPSPFRPLRVMTLFWEMLKRFMDDEDEESDSMT